MLSSTLGYIENFKFTWRDNGNSYSITNDLLYVGIVVTVLPEIIELVKLANFFFFFS